MKTHTAMVLLSFALAVVSARAEDGVTFVAAVKSIDRPKNTISKDWGVDVGEIYIFDHYVSKQQVEGNFTFYTTEMAQDKTYVILRFDAGTVTVPANCIAFVKTEDYAAAAQKYAAEVAQSRQDEADAHPPMHSRFANPYWEGRFIAISQQIHQQTGHWPSTQVVMGMIAQEQQDIRQQQDLTDAINGLTDAVNKKRR